MFLLHLIPEFVYNLFPSLDKRTLVWSEFDLQRIVEEKIIPCRAKLRFIVSRDVPKHRNNLYLKLDKKSDWYLLDIKLIKIDDQSIQIVSSNGQILRFLVSKGKLKKVLSIIKAIDQGSESSIVHFCSSSATSKSSPSSLTSSTERDHSCIKIDLSDLNSRVISHNKSPSNSSPSISNDKLSLNSNLNSDSDDIIESQSNNQSNRYWFIPYDHLQFDKFNDRELILGEGSFGQVLKAYYRPGELNVAVKRVTGKYGQIEREFEIMVELSHPNIVSVIGLVKEPETMLIMEYMEHGSLIQFLRSLNSNQVNSIPFAKYALDIASGMEYLEKSKIVHRDLAARNILMASINEVKISDFGLSHLLPPGNYAYKIVTQQPLPICWYAPESIKINPTFSSKSDVWSFGVTLWEIFALGDDLNYPYDVKKSEVKLYRHLMRGATLTKPDKNVPGTDLFWSIMVNCWRINSNERPNFTQLKEIIRFFLTTNQQLNNCKHDYIHADQDSKTNYQQFTWYQL